MKVVSNSETVLHLVSSELNCRAALKYGWLPLPFPPFFFENFFLYFLVDVFFAFLLLFWVVVLMISVSLLTAPQSGPELR